MGEGPKLETRCREDGLQTAGADRVGTTYDPDEVRVQPVSTAEVPSAKPVDIAGCAFAALLLNLGTESVW